MTETTASADIIDFLAGLDPDSEISGQVARLRHNRAQARDNAQQSFHALFEPETPGDFTLAERYAVAAFVSGLHGGATAGARAASFYTDLLVDELDGDATPEQADEFLTTLAAVVSDARAHVHGSGVTAPYGVYREPDLAAESAPGPEFRLLDRQRDTFGPRLSAALEFSHVLVLHPRDSRAERLRPLAAVGWSPTEVVRLAQLVSFLTFQIRTAHGLGVLATKFVPQGDIRQPGMTVGARQADTPHRPLHADPAPGTGVDAGFEVITYPDLVRPARFVTHSLGWVPWVPPVEEADLTDRQKEALVDPLRAKSAYFRLLARDPDSLEARTLTDRDIFFNVTDGVGRAERELSAAVTSRFNGCVYCASVHTGRTIAESASDGDARAKADAVQRLCDEGVTADLGSDLWNAVRDASVALAAFPVRFGTSHVASLRDAGLEDAEIIDVINAASFFNWANRLMLSLGEPELPKRFR
ncbi:alkylhydroperoxidase domain protein [Corynebacterium provencense]|jgi:alkylhydroperoxidase domain protein/CMD domain protein|uniref:Carboxymuconolactone decarboxylase-like domain-containing protein n=1 Tax=Corynebacterium provencense TaxID=1737425 RepID=A0A2Z3YNZ2_9CORY|nr:alkylhydroperoxidase domain protein [Corynebacterium provencense]AWT25041.1 hypothetical protein Csp1_02130 [Corynebacterium provencense]MCI1255702.1 alkylhydroperoxidase domain protein [Corynebacterium provencense]